MTMIEQIIQNTEYATIDSQSKLEDGQILLETNAFATYVMLTS